MSTQPSASPVFEMRVALTTQDYERLVRFYCDGLGIEPAQIWDSGQNRARLLEMGRATLELFNEAQAEMVDGLEVGERVRGRVRFAFQVPDLQAAVERLLAHGATLVHAPVRTPWGDYNARLQDPDGMQVTLFQVMGEEKAP